MPLRAALTLRSLSSLAQPRSAVASAWPVTRRQVHFSVSLCRAESSSGGQSPEQDDCCTSEREDDGTHKLSTADALARSLGGVSTAVGRISQSTNIVLGADDSEEKWRELDGQVNEYPGQQTFKAIGAGGDDFVAAMRQCVESVVGPVHEECISQRASATGKYVSATIGPVWVHTPEQVLEIFSKMKEDGRLKYYI